MGSGDWFKRIMHRKRSQQQHKSSKPAKNLPIGITPTNSSVSTPGVEDSSVMIEEAATRIQTAFRRYKAKKTLRSLKGTQRLRIISISQASISKKQATAALNHIQSWNRLQAEIRDRRAFMVSESRSRQKKQESQLKLEAKLHDFEVEWSGGSETMEEALARIQQREEAAVKRERAMAYAFSHQWRAKSGVSDPFIYGVAKGGWGWSWMDRWVASRPWEPRAPVTAARENQRKPSGKMIINQPVLKHSASAVCSSDGGNKKVSKKAPLLPPASPAAAIAV